MKDKKVKPKIDVVIVTKPTSKMGGKSGKTASKPTGKAGKSTGKC